MTKNDNSYKNGQDISNNCVKCGSEVIANKEILTLEWAPFWATYLAATGVFKFIYLKYAEKATLKIGYCKKHMPGAILKRLYAYGTLLTGGILIFLGVNLEMVWMSFVGVIMLFVFLGQISNSIPVKVSRITDGKIWLSKPLTKPK